MPSNYETESKLGNYNYFLFPVFFSTGAGEYRKTKPHNKLLKAGLNPYAFYMLIIKRDDGRFYEWFSGREVWMVEKGKTIYDKSFYTFFIDDRLQIGKQPYYYSVSHPSTIEAGFRTVTAVEFRAHVKAYERKRRLIIKYYEDEIENAVLNMQKREEQDRKLRKAEEDAEAFLRNSFGR